MSEGGSEDFLPLIDWDCPAINKAAFVVESEDEHRGGVVRVARGIDCLDPGSGVSSSLRGFGEEDRRLLVREQRDRVPGLRVRSPGAELGWTPTVIPALREGVAPDQRGGERCEHWSDTRSEQAFLL